MCVVSAGSGSCWETRSAGGTDTPECSPPRHSQLRNFCSTCLPEGHPHVSRSRALSTPAVTNMPRVERLTNSFVLGGLLLAAMLVMFAATARENIGRDSG